MPAFKFFAGFSPNCAAVRVQTEHCAVAEKCSAVSAQKRRRRNQCLLFIIRSETKLDTELFSERKKCTKFSSSQSSKLFRRTVQPKILLQMIFKALCPQRRERMSAKEIFELAVVVFTFRHFFPKSNGSAKVFI